MKRAAEHLPEIQSRIAAVLDEYEWDGARTAAHVWIHGADPELLNAAEAIPANRRYVSEETGCVTVSPIEDRISMCVFGGRQEKEAPDAA